MLIYYTIYIVGGIILIHQLILLWFQSVANKGSKKLTKNNVKELIDIEKSKLGIKHKRIEWDWDAKCASNSELIGKIYYIHFLKSAKESTVKHEVFHIFRGDCDNHGTGFFNWIKIMILFWSIYEFRAKLYAAYNIKL
jgi:hypothetical protein